MKTKKLQQAYEKMMKDPAFYNDFMSKLHQIYIREKLAVCCLAEDPGNMLMWSHYAASHTGVCLCFEIERNGFMYPNVLPVQYKYRYPHFLLSDYADEKKAFYTMHQQAVCTKSLYWEYEHEWRVVLDSGAGAYPFEKPQLRKLIFGINTPQEIITKTKKLLADQMRSR